MVGVVLSVWSQFQARVGGGVVDGGGTSKTGRLGRVRDGDGARRPQRRLTRRLQTTPATTPRHGSGQLLLFRE